IAGALDFVAEDELLDDRTPLAAKFLGPADPQPAVGAHLVERLAIVRTTALAGLGLLLQLRSHQLGEIRAQLVAQGALLSRVIDVHICLPQKWRSLVMMKR